MDSQRQLMRIPHIKVNQDKKMTVKPEFIRNQNDSPRHHVGETMLIHSFDPNHISMPKYSSKYKNEKNAGAIRHLLGGRRGDGSAPNNSDLRASTV